MQQTVAAVKPAGAISRSTATHWHFSGLALAMSITAYWGFSYTYFRPALAGVYPEAALAVHIHGWSFFLWFLLLPIQTFLIAVGRRRMHMTLGGLSMVLAVVTVFTGILVASVRISDGMAAVEPNEFTTFWKDFGQLIMYSMLLFAGFYGTAIAQRRNPEFHKRMMILASASVLPAAIFRIIVGMSDYYWLATPVWVMPAAFLLPAVFIVLGMLHDRITLGYVQRAYLIGLPVLLVVNVMGILLAGTGAGEIVSEIMASFAKVFGGLY